MLPSRSNSCADYRIIRTALLPEFGGMGIGATDFIRLLMRKLMFNRIGMPFAAFVQQRRRGRSQTVNSQFGLAVSETAQGTRRRYFRSTANDSKTAGASVSAVERCAAGASTVITIRSESNST